MSFHERRWEKRFASMGDESEGVFEHVYPYGFTRTGLNRPPIRLDMVPNKIRCLPDYLTSKGFVECMGVGRDGKLKLKQAKLNALIEWDADFRTDLFVWDSHRKQYCFAKIMHVAYVAVESPQKYFHDGPLYYEIDVDALDVTWQSYDPEGDLEFADVTV